MYYVVDFSTVNSQCLNVAGGNEKNQLKQENQGRKTK